MAGYAGTENLVDGAWLESHLSDANLRIVDCDMLDAYRRAHIPGAIPIAGSQTAASLQANFWKNPDNGVFVMTAEQFAARMAEMGISNDTEVVAYDDSNSSFSGRLWWCLSYFGHTKVRVLNGGWRRWLAELRPMTMAETKIPPASFTPRVKPDLHASAEYVMQALERPDVVVLDVRSDGEWDGTNTRGNKRGGHMPGAVHLEYVNNLSPADNRSFKPVEALRKQYADLGVTPDKEVITVCQGGIRAAQAALTLKLLGFERVRNYDGSFREWANREDTPITA